MKKAALFSVSDKTGIVDFAKELVSFGFVILSTSGTKKALEDAGIGCLSIENYTGQKEILDGRVKTLHPKIHAGILADRRKLEHVEELNNNEILSIDLVVVNLYPFTKYLDTPTAEDPEKMIELIDIGGPSMLRAAAKNSHSTLPVIDASDYGLVIAALRESAGEILKIDKELKRRLMAKVFQSMAEYDFAIANYFRQGEQGVSLMLSAGQKLRYGENPQQEAYYYSFSGEETPKPWLQLQGKELSYNNLLDFDAMFRLLRDLSSDKTAAAIIKHLNPCGAAYAESQLAALELAKKGDPRSHFGGIIGFNSQVEEKTAANVAEDFAEIVVAPKFSAGALKIFSQKKNLRLIEVNLAAKTTQEYRSVLGGLLVQTPDTGACELTESLVASKQKPSASELASLNFAWQLCAHVKSNAITLVSRETLIGVGAGQMSRIDSVEIAVSKAKLHGHDLNGALAASDAFFPFPDSIEYLAEQGIKCIVAPSGSRKDPDVVAAADALGICLLFAPERHFRH